MSGHPGCSRRKAAEMPPALSLATSPTPTRRRLEVLPIGIFLALAVLPAAAPLAGGEHLLSLGSRVMIFAIAAVALDLLVGYGALISFGHAAFIGLGAYAVGILATHGIGDALVSLPVALAFGQMAFFTASSLAPYGGDDGLTIAARSTLAGFPVLRNERAFYYVVFACLLAAYLFCRVLVASRF